MILRPLGRTGLVVSEVGLGCNSLGGRIGEAASGAVVHAALDRGITFFDTANTYGNRYGSPGGSESALGRLLGARRQDVVLATKFGCQSNKHESIPVEGASRGEIVAAVHASLQRLRTDWIDLYQLHYPDPHTPIEETLRTLEDLVRQGKIRCFGCSNFDAAAIGAAQSAATALGMSGFATCQKEYSVLAREPRRELAPILEKHGISLLPFYPLAAGLLTGKYSSPDGAPPGTRLATQRRLSERFLTKDKLAAVDRLQRYAAGHGRSLLELAFGWLLAQPVVASVIAGATSAEQVAANASAARWRLTSQEMDEIETAVAAAEAVATPLASVGSHGGTP